MKSYSRFHEFEDWFTTVAPLILLLRVRPASSSRTISPRLIIPQERIVTVDDVIVNVWLDLADIQSWRNLSHTQNMDLLDPSFLMELCFEAA